MPRVGFEPTISEGERPKTYALDRAATGTGADLQIAWEISAFISFMPDAVLLLNCSGQWY